MNSCDPNDVGKGVAVLVVGSRSLIATTAAMALVSGLGQLGTKHRSQQVSKHTWYTQKYRCHGHFALGTPTPWPVGPRYFAMLGIFQSHYSDTLSRIPKPSHNNHWLGVLGNVTAHQTRCCCIFSGATPPGHMSFPPVTLATPAGCRRYQLVPDATSFTTYS